MPVHDIVNQKERRDGYKKAAASFHNHQEKCACKRPLARSDKCPYLGDHFASAWFWARNEFLCLHLLDVRCDGKCLGPPSRRISSSLASDLSVLAFLIDGLFFDPQLRRKLLCGLLFSSFLEASVLGPL